MARRLSDRVPGTNNKQPAPGVLLLWLLFAYSDPPFYVVQAYSKRKS